MGIEPIRDMKTVGRNKCWYCGVNMGIDWLGQCRAMAGIGQRAIEAYLEAVHHLESPPTPSFGDKVQGSERAGMEAQIDRLWATSARMRAILHEYAIRRDAIIEALALLGDDDDDEYDVLFKYYVELKSWATIAKEMNRSESWVYKTRKQGVSKLTKNLDITVQIDDNDTIR